MNKLFQNILFAIPIPTLYRILVNYSEKYRSNIESENEIIDFLFEYISKKGIESTFLLSIFDFKADEIEYFNDKLTEYYQDIDFNSIGTKLLQNSRILHQHHKDKEAEIFSRLEKIEQNRLDAVKTLENDIKQMKNEQENKITVLENAIQNADEKLKLKEIEFEQQINQIQKDHFNEIQQLNKKLKNQDNQILETKLIILSNVKNNIEIPEPICSSSFAKFTIPSTFTSITAQNFQGCNILQEIIIPNSIISIEDNAFEGCTSLKQIVIPNSVKTIGNYSFSNRTSLSQLTIDLYQTKFEDDSFYECSSLNTLVITSKK